MSQVRAALSANTFNADHAVAMVDFLQDCFGLGRLVKTWPTAAGIKFGFRSKQPRIAAHAVVVARLPVVSVFAREGPFRGGAARDFKGQRLSALCAQMFAPCVIGLGQCFVGHGVQEEQLISMEAAQSGGRPA